MKKMAAMTNRIMKLFDKVPTVVLSTASLEGAVDTFDRSDKL